MEIAMIGLGRMGGNMVQRLLKGGHRVVAFDMNEAAIAAAESHGAVGARTFEEIAAKLSPPRAVWVMVPSGDPTEKCLNSLSEHLSPGDILIDGGNSNFKDSQRRSDELKAKGFHFVDVGTSGGVWGLKEGYSIMVGGEETIVEHLRPIFETLAPAPNVGWGRVGPAGSGHFVKMIHNGIEYGMMQSYAEGFSLLHKKAEFALDLPQIAEIWRTGSVVRSWLLDLTAEALKENPSQAGIAPYVPDSGEGRWTVQEAVDLDVPAPVITMSLILRLRSRDTEDYSDRLIASMRNQFGGHAIKQEK